ncbi:S1 family peptidase [Candidatus Thiosymbion oneisti]|uniref:S1 family peptidase n=1 Tax=Candidatus Thiosymbion oneisti TaxID=589554 RepID=UPI00105C9161|nr:S1 family peptidase [Candidatus Thiosymbion oneisti]
MTTRITLSLATFVVALLASTAVVSETGPQLGTTQTPGFQELLEAPELTFAPLPSEPEDVGTELINGTVVGSRYFPTVFRMTTGGTCTGTLVGEATLLVAAHCVENGARIRFVLKSKRIRGICKHAPGYSEENPSEDWALCLLEYPVTGIKYERVDVSRTPEIDTKVKLMGYGCTERDGPLDGKLRIGNSKVVSKPSRSDRCEYRFPNETSTIYTKSDVAKGEAVICPGDSGGPLFVFRGNSANDARDLVGVNSRTTFEKCGVSLFAAVGSEKGKAFFKRWAKRHGQKICGVNTDKSYAKDNCH